MKPRALGVVRIIAKVLVGGDEVAPLKRIRVGAVAVTDPQQPGCVATRNPSLGYLCLCQCCVPRDGARFAECFTRRTSKGENLIVLRETRSIMQCIGEYDQVFWPDRRWLFLCAETRSNITCFGMNVQLGDSP